MSDLLHLSCFYKNASIATRNHPFTHSQSLPATTPVPLVNLNVLDHSLHFADRRWSLKEQVVLKERLGQLRTCRQEKYRSL